MKATSQPAAGPMLVVSALQCDDHRPGEQCRYQIAWTINPHMASSSVDFAQAAAEHATFVAALDSTDAIVERMPFVHGAYDSVFVKDPALLLMRRGRKQALLARFQYAERRQERGERARYYEHQGYDIVAADRGPHWEGGDVVMLPDGDGLCFGYGFRSHYAATAWLERHIGKPVWPLELSDPRLFHLDMVLAMLPNGIALVCPSALTPQSICALERVRGLRRLIMVSHESALRFALNLITVGDTIVLGSHDPHIEALIESLGYRCVVVPLRQFHLAGGSAACLVATVHCDPRE